MLLPTGNLPETKTITRSAGVSLRPILSSKNQQTSEITANQLENKGFSPQLIVVWRPIWRPSLEHVLMTSAEKPQYPLKIADKYLENCKAGES